MKTKEIKDFDSYRRLAVFATLPQFDPSAKEHDFIEVAQWGNGEGFDVTISNNHRDVLIQLTYGEFDAIKKLVKALDKVQQDEWEKKREKTEGKRWQSGDRTFPLD